MHRIELGIYAVTMLVIVVQDLLLGVITGVALSAVRLLYVFTRLETDLAMTTDLAQARIRLTGAATFIRLPKLAAELERVPPGAELHVDMRGLHYIDHACLDLLMSWAKRHEAQGGRLVINWNSLQARFTAEPQLMPQTLPEAEASRPVDRNGSSLHGEHPRPEPHHRNGHAAAREIGAGVGG